MDKLVDPQVTVLTDGGAGAPTAAPMTMRESPVLRVTLFSDTVAVLLVSVAVPFGQRMTLLLLQLLLLQLLLLRLPRLPLPEPLLL